jgi:hypothetical protein
VWTLDPIEVRGNHFYHTKTWKQFRMRGIGFPDIPSEDVKEWIKVLQRISQLSSKINTIRIYRPPKCALDVKSDCFEDFMLEADRLGIYVLIAGSGTSWGYFPGHPDACDPPISTGLQGCYQVGGLLGFGRTIIQKFNYPNTLAIVIANEIEQNLDALPVLKAYARDLKAYMNMCNTEDDSPTKGMMRQIPLVYAATDKGDAFYDQADYLFCGEKDASIDAYGLNIERWVSDDGGKTEYDKVNKDVVERQWPGAFFYSEEGGPYSESGGPYPRVRTWTQIPGFFASWPNIDGFLSYAYYGNPNFNMFDGPTYDATIKEDGKAWFEALAQVGEDPASQEPQIYQPSICKTSIHIHSDYSLQDYKSIKAYDTGENGWGKNCPKPWQKQNANATSAVVV